MGYCSKCHERWPGTARAHFTGCHKTFRSAGGFDKHRKDFACLDPANIGMEMDEKGSWLTPMPEDVKRRLGCPQNTPPEVEGSAKFKPKSRGGRGTHA